MDKEEILRQLEEKYDPFKNVKRHDLKHWTDSEAVCRLSEYLRIHQDQGISLVSKNGRMTLQFLPRIRPDQKERLRHAQISVDLLLEALDDLKYLIRHGLITLPPYVDPDHEENATAETDRGSFQKESYTVRVTGGSEFNSAQAGMFDVTEQFKRIYER